MEVGCRSRPRVCLRATCALLACILLTLPTRADEAQNSALARSLFDEGVTASDVGDWKAAVERFSRAYALRPTSGIAFNLANAEIEVGKIVRASEHLRAVIHDESAAKELRERARLRLEEVVARIAFAIIRVETASEDFELRIDGIALPPQAWGAATPIDPGEHVIDLVRQGQVHDTRTVHVRDGERTQLTLTGQITNTLATPVGSEPAPNAVAPVETTVSPMTAATPRNDAAGRDKRWMWWTALGVAVAAGVTVGVVLGTRDEGAKSETPVSGNTSEGVIRW